MAVKFILEAAAYSTTVQVPQNAYTVTWWAKLNTDRNLYSTMWEPGSTTGTAVYTQIGLEGDGTAFGVHTSGGGNLNAAFQMAVQPSSSTANWYCFAAKQTAQSGTLRIGYGTDPDSLTWVDIAAPPSNPGTLRIGRSCFGGEWFNGSIASWKQWDAVLTDAEAVAELKQYVEVRSANLVRRHDFKTATGVIDAGTGGNLSGGSGASTAIGPNIPDALAIALPPRRRSRGPNFRR